MKSHSVAHLVHREESLEFRKLKSFAPLAVLGLLLAVFFSPSALISKNYIILSSRGAGLFSVFQDVLMLVQEYDQKQLAGGHVDFGQTGLYYDSKVGQNWWEYYFEPINLGSAHSANIKEMNDLHGMRAEICNSRQYNHYLIEKYIQLAPHIREKITALKSQLFQDHFVIGVHYRGTDKSSEAPRINYESVLAEIQKQLSQLQLTSFKIFIATDEEPFVDYLQAHFPSQLCYVKETIRSINGCPLHIDPLLGPYNSGESAVIDCLLLSETQLLIRTSSNLSLCSTFFNPKLPVVCLSERNHFPEQSFCNEKITSN